MKAKEVIDVLQLEPLTVEGGFFKELYRSKSIMPDGKRTCGTSIYYLMTIDNISSWHKVASDEIWYYHAGSPAIQLLISPDGTLEKRIIGNDFAAGQVAQSIIPAGTWQAAILKNKNPDAWGLFGASVFPAFEYDDFTGASVEEMSKNFPEHKAVIDNFFP